MLCHALLICVANYQSLSSQVLDRVKQCTVLIVNKEDGKVSSFGSGVVVDGGRSILTAKHVVIGRDNSVDSCTVVFGLGDNEPQLVEIPSEQILVTLASKQDKDFHRNDIAIIELAIRRPFGLELYPRDGKLDETTPIWSLGFPSYADDLDDGKLPTPTVHTLRLERVVRQNGDNILVQISGSLSFGDSGGPIVDAEGRVIALVQGGYGKTTAGIGVPTWKRVYATHRGSSTSITKIAPIHTDVPPQRPHQSQNRGPALSSITLTESDCIELGVETVQYMVNRLYAWHGYIFKDKALKRHFERERWYKPRIKDMRIVEKRFNKLERENWLFATKWIRRHR